MSGPAAAGPPPGAPPIGVNVSDYGIQLIGVVISSILFGISCLQTFIYYMAKPKDPIWLKLLPAWLMFLQLARLILLVVVVYKILVVDFGHPERLATIPSEAYCANIIVGVLAFSAQLFYIWRIWKFGKSKSGVSKYMWIFGSFCLLLAVTFLILTVTNAGLELKHGGSLAFLLTETYNATSYTFAATNFVLDFLIVIAMVWLLRIEGRSQYARTNNVINRLMILSINSGLVTMTAALIFIITLATSPQTYVYIFFYYLTAPLYCNSVLANLNSREWLRRQAGQTESYNLRSRNLARVEFNGAMQNPMHNISKGSHPDSETPYEVPDSHLELGGSNYLNNARDRIRVTVERSSL